MFFRKFKKATYEIDGRKREIVNILRAVLPKLNNVESSFVFQRYTVRQGDRPEMVANELYKNPNYYWTIILINNIVNPYLDWLLTDEELEAYTEEKYGSLYGVHHYYHLETGRWFDEVDTANFREMENADLPEFVIPVTNLQYEAELNRERGQIIVINPVYIELFVDSYNRAMEGRE